MKHEEYVSYQLAVIISAYHASCVCL